MTGVAGSFAAYLLAYFHDESNEDGEQVRFAVSDGPDPLRWIPLAGGSPVLRSDVGERGVRDPFLVRDSASGRFLLLATDLRTYPDFDWHRATRHGSRSIVIWESRDLVDWGPSTLRAIAPENAGNAWAPKAYWSDPDARWMVFWASSLFAQDDDRRNQYQRILVASTEDFAIFSEPRVYWDEGHDVIDASFLEFRGDVFRFSANSLAPTRAADRGHHVLVEKGTGLFDPHFEVVTEDLGKPELRRAEGPAPVLSLDATRAWVLLDEFGLRGYRLFSSSSPATGEWTIENAATLPPRARHGSLLPITSAEKDALLAKWGR